MDDGESRHAVEVWAVVFGMSDGVEDMAVIVHVGDGVFRDSWGNEWCKIKIRVVVEMVVNFFVVVVVVLVVVVVCKDRRQYE